ncbi:uncharacterized protein LOC132833546 [Hemiscyllium ocellatum]|uniref:uncharacterized protein LOC132833546 n=1 Tax=Hemiscyllium ocellatum TaxID=170820 RepID=UPI002966D941|nr:uncharacterized protein LOC132833546 [Hemiscyllium ocellatum]
MPSRCPLTTGHRLSAGHNTHAQSRTLDLQSAGSEPAASEPLGHNTHASSRPLGLQSAGSVPAVSRPLGDSNFMPFGQRAQAQCRPLGGNAHARFQLFTQSLVGTTQSTRKNWKKFGKMILLSIITSILCTYSYAFERQGNCKTQWFDRDDPSGNGDYEDLVNLRKAYPNQICSNPTTCEVETTSGILESSSGDNITECSVSSGFICTNKDQQDGKCEDFKIRFTCPESFCSCKTEWFDRDDPSGKGDSEDLVNLRKDYPEQICSNPIACEVATTAGDSAGSTGDNIPECSILNGFTCTNADQEDGNCKDYKIRFICPESFFHWLSHWAFADILEFVEAFPSPHSVDEFLSVYLCKTCQIINMDTTITCQKTVHMHMEDTCNCKTQWFDRDNPSVTGDYEDLENLRKEYPNQICSSPTACEVETTTGVPASNTGDNIPE